LVESDLFSIYHHMPKFCDISRNWYGIISGGGFCPTTTS